MPQNDHETHVRRIQRALRILNRNGIEVPEVFEDGIYGDETANSVSEYQRNKGFAPTGVVNKETWDNLMNDAGTFIELNAPASPVMPFLNDESHLTCEGEECWSVFFAQSMLKFLATLYSGFTDLEVNGINDAVTSKNLKYLQERSDTLYEDGTLDRTTWNALANLFGIMFK